jgi:DNA-binding GntR family transcriptional regulator
MGTYAAVFDKYFRYQMIALNYRGEEPARQHQDLLDCALTRDAVRAKAVLVEHVTGCVVHALASGAVR